MKKTFDCVEMKREIQERIDRETQGMSVEERVEHTRLASERFRAEIALMPGAGKGLADLLRTLSQRKAG